MTVGGGGSKLFFGRRRALTLRLAMIMAAAMVLMFSVFVVWNGETQRRQADAEMLDKARLLSKERDAVWKFFEVNQSYFAKDEDGNYQMYCVIAAKSVSMFFTNDSDCVIHYTNLTTRRESDAPDEFETEALEALVEDSSLSEYYSLGVEEDGRQVFRYVKPLFAGESCLECHGEPAGELDPFGFEKEGMKLGDIAGAVSITMPVGSYLGNIDSNVKSSVAFFAVVIVAAFAVMLLSVSRLVTRPLAHLRDAAVRIDSGDLDVDLVDVGGKDEIAELATCFSSMASSLKSVYEGLEEQIEGRTKQLVEANEELLEQRSRLEDANAALVAASRYQSDFIATMSHELRTPLTSIIAFAEIIERGGGSCDAATIKEIRANSYILLNMVDNILEMARVDAGKTRLVLEPVDMVDLSNIVESSLAILAERQGVDFRVEVDLDVPLVNADWEKVRRVMVNLASNAIKFTPSGGSVDVRVRNLDAEGCFAIDVRDTGVGIAQSDLSRIFERFAQVGDPRIGHSSGSGLGLAVVSELVEAMGGAVSVKSSVGRGSTFTVTLPTEVHETEVEDEDYAC